MNNSDRNAFYSALEAAYELYGKKPSDAAAKLYFETLSRYELKDVLRGLSAHVQNPDNGQYLPKPADIIRVLDGDTQTAGLKAWSKVVSAIRSVGPYQDVVFDDPAIHAIISDMGGWVQINQITEDELPFKSNEFVKRYKGALSGINEIEYPKLLTGISNAYNSVEGHGTSRPVLIGDPNKARQVYRLGRNNAGSQITRIAGGAVKKIGNDNSIPGE